MNASEALTMLAGLKLEGMAQAFEQMLSDRSTDELTLPEIVGRLCMAQRDKNQEQALARLRRAARFRVHAQPEDILWDAHRGFDKQKLRSLLQPDWVRRVENVLLSGASGTGKTWLACAIGNALVRQGISVRYVRTNLLLQEMRAGHLDRSISRLRKNLTAPQLLILDDFGIAPIDEPSKEDLFELLEARSDVGSTLIAGQKAPSEWYDYLASNHLADAIMDRVVQRAHRIELKGDSLRQRL